MLHTPQNTSWHDTHTRWQAPHTPLPQNEQGIGSGLLHCRHDDPRDAADDDADDDEDEDDDEEAPAPNDSAALIMTSTREGTRQRKFKNEKMAGSGEQSRLHQLGGEGWWLLLVADGWQ